MSGISVRTGARVPTQRTRDTARAAAPSSRVPVGRRRHGAVAAVAQVWRAGARDVLGGLERHWATMSVWRL